MCSISICPISIQTAGFVALHLFCMINCLKHLYKQFTNSLFILRNCDSDTVPHFHHFIHPSTHSLLRVSFHLMVNAYSAHTYGHCIEHILIFLFIVRTPHAFLFAGDAGGMNIPSLMTLLSTLPRFVIQ